MKVYLEPGTQSRGLLRVRDALVKYAPKKVKVVPTLSECDLAILHVYGRHTTTEKQIRKLREAGKKYAMIQYCLRSTMRDSTSHWIDMWKRAKVVWSYYDLEALCIEDHMNIPDMNFYYAPLGVDGRVFYERLVSMRHKRFVIMASAQHALSESVRECAFAAKRVGRYMFHLGHELRRGEDIVCKNGLTDDEVAEYYSQSEFVSGLRREEGFEFPVVEGLLCGARPIVFDRPEMRQWYGEFAIFIKEQDRPEVIDSLEKIFKQGTSPITDGEKKLALERFDWETIITNFWNNL